MTRRAGRADVVRRVPRAIAAPPDSLLAGGLARRFLSEESGATMVEYGMLIALIAIAVMGALYLLGGSLSVKLTQVATCLTTRVCP